MQIFGIAVSKLFNGIYTGCFKQFVMVMDMKGDLSGLGAAGTTNMVIETRARIMDMAWKGEAFPEEFLTISREPGARMKATISEDGPVLLSKILELNENQSGVLAMLFKFCDPVAR